MRYLGVDFGLKKVGLAISEGELASPLKVINVTSLADAISGIKKEVSENNIDKLVIGLPEGSTGRSATKLINGLKREKLRVEIADETLSSQNTQKLLIEMGVSRKKRGQEDAMAAAEILQNYLDSKI